MEITRNSHVDVEQVSFEQYEDYDDADYKFWNKIRCIVGGRVGNDVPAFPRILTEEGHTGNEVTNESTRNSYSNSY